MICRRFSLTLEGHRINGLETGAATREITEDAFLDDTFWIIDGPLHFGYPIDAAFSFQTEGEEFDEAGMETAMEAFRAHLAVISAPGDRQGAEGESPLR